MGFNNGYDAGWQDAINEVRHGKVPGLGPASGGSGAAPAPTYMTNAANRYAMVTDSARVRYAAPESVTAAVDGTAFNLQAPTDVPAGTVMNVNLTFETRPGPGYDDWDETWGSSAGVSAITVNGVAPSGMPTYGMNDISGLLDLVLWYDGVSWVYVADEETHA